MPLYSMYYYKKAVSLRYFGSGYCLLCSLTHSRPYDSRMWCAVAGCHEQLNQIDEAIKCYSRAVDNDDGEVSLLLYCYSYLSTIVFRLTFIGCARVSHMCVRLCCVCVCWLRVLCVICDCEWVCHTPCIRRAWVGVCVPWAVLFWWRFCGDGGGCCCCCCCCLCFVETGRGLRLITFQDFSLGKLARLYEKIKDREKACFYYRKILEKKDEEKA